MDYLSREIREELVKAVDQRLEIIKKDKRYIHVEKEQKSILEKLKNTLNEDDYELVENLTYCLTHKYF